MTALSRMTARLSALRAASGLGRRSMACELRVVVPQFRPADDQPAIADLQALQAVPVTPLQLLPQASLILWRRVLEGPQGVVTDHRQGVIGSRIGRHKRLGHAGDRRWRGRAAIRRTMTVMEGWSKTASP